MENIILAIDATNLDMSALDFACYLGRLTHSKITGVFLENLVNDEKMVLKRMHYLTYVDWEIDESSTEMQQKRSKIEANILLFKEACKKRSVNFSIHCEEGVPAAEMIAESRYADIIVTDAATSFKKVFEGVPTHFVKDLLKDAECPVIIAPERLDGIDSIVFAYDGSRSAAFAMKQFTYLFPEFDDKKVTVFHVKENSEWTAEEKQKLTGWLQNHYSAIGFETASGDAGYELLAYLFLKKNVFIVMGAYGRSAFSRFFKHSRADILVKTITQPIFITHY
jgi:nucleotide-binding universal stress UspA family protein